MDGDYKIEPLSIMLPKTSAYVKSYDSKTKWMGFLTEDDELVRKYKDIWKRVSNNIKTEFDSEPIYKKKFLNTKIKFYGDQPTDFHDKVRLQQKIVAILIGYVFKRDENYYPQVFLKECKYNEKEKK